MFELRDVSSLVFHRRVVVNRSIAQPFETSVMSFNVAVAAQAVRMKEKGHHYLADSRATHQLLS